MKHDRRYIQSETDFLQYATASLGPRFLSLDDFNRFYAFLPDDEAKNAFLRVSSFYLFLVKNGDWVNRRHDGKELVTDYLTNSYKLVGIFSLIESLADREHQDFYRWLCSNENGVYAFPIESSRSLVLLFNKYNQRYGATNHCVAFFELLPPEGQHALMQSIHIRGKAVSSVKRAVQALYGLRSRFVHEANLLVHLSNQSVLSNLKGKMYSFDLKLAEFAGLFEEALIMHFAVKHRITLERSAKNHTFVVR